MKKINLEFHLMQLFILFLLGITSSNIVAQKHTGDVFVDKMGVMRWGDTKEEVKGFGVNYTAPFAHAYRTAELMGVDIKKAIDGDVYHFSRLGFDLYRIHVWDTEISDAEGNLLNNAHLDAFDYLINSLKAHQINYVITPIAFWGNGWPEPDEDTPGFSQKYGKDNSLINPEAIKAAENYLAQFLEHKNKYTGIAYKNDPSLIAVEVSNEPHHRESPEAVTAYVKKMVKAIKSTGTKKPIFYNISHSVQLAEAYFKAGIQGGTFQWYPTGLGYGKELEGNLLPNVNSYIIPFNEVIQKYHGAKLVYEFDAANGNKSYIYPAMARSFREAGIQIATHFSYDPSFMAATNTEYNTHYMNLVYTPQKALSLMIASKIFHEVPMNSDFGKYPENKTFNSVKLDYQKDLAEYNVENTFIYTNSTETTPRNISTLEHISGFGNSAVVNYSGTGAYFLDKLDGNAWRLEVMPDALLIDNPFGKNNLEKKISILNYAENLMILKLPTLGENFNVEAINKGNSFKSTSEGFGFKIMPGTYLISKNGSANTNIASTDFKFGKLGDFVAPEGSNDKTRIVHEPVASIEQNAALTINATMISPDSIEEVTLYLNNSGVYDSVKMEKVSAYSYKAPVPEKLLNSGYLNYRIAVKTSKEMTTFPGAVKSDPFKWDNYEQAQYSTAIIPKKTDIYLFTATQKEVDYLAGDWRPKSKRVPINNNGKAEYQVILDELFTEDAENTKATPIYDYSLRYNFQSNIKGIENKLSHVGSIVFKGRSLSGKTEKLQLALVDNNGFTFGKIINLTSETKEHEINLSELQPVKTVTLPRPYPSFLPYYFEHTKGEEFKIENVEAVQLSIGPGLNTQEQKEPHSFAIESIRFQVLE